MNKTKVVQFNVSLNISKIVWLITAIGLFLIIVSTVGQIIKYNYNLNYKICSTIINNFFLGYESNIPTYFSSLLNLFSSMLLLLITIMESGRNAKYVFHWAILSIGFLYISLDEMITIHEWFSEQIKSVLGYKDLGIFTFAWVVPGIVIVLILAVFYSRFLIQLQVNTRRWFLIAAMVFIGGAIGVELLGGKHYEVYGAENLKYRMMQTLEETMEMTGLIIFVWRLLKYIADQFGSIRLDFRSKSN